MKKSRMFLVAMMVGSLAACGVEETGLSPVDQEQSEDDGFQADTGDDIDSDAGMVEEIDDEMPLDEVSDTAEEPIVDEPVVEEPAEEPADEVPAEEAVVVANADVISSPGACQLMFSALYVGGATAGQIRGSLPGVATWDAGPDIEDSDADGYLEFLPASLPTGTFDLSYVGGSSDWALYGAKEQLLGMSAEARSFVSCNWFDGNEEIPAASPECHLRISVAPDCTITGAGNMANLQ